MIDTPHLVLAPPPQDAGAAPLHHLPLPPHPGPDPVQVFAPDPGGHAGAVPLGAASAPAHHADQDPPAIHSLLLLLLDPNGTAAVTLTGVLWASARTIHRTRHTVPIAGMLSWSNNERIWCFIVVYYNCNLLCLNRQNLSPHDQCQPSSSFVIHSSSS